MSNSQMVVATKFKLLSPISLKEGKWDKNGAKENLGTKIVERSFVEHRNSFDNNELYVIDEEATKEMLKKREENIKLQEEENAKKAQKEVSNNDLAAALVAIASKEKSKPKKESKPKEEISHEISTDGMSLEEKKEYLTQNGIEFHHKAGEGKINELIQELKSK